MPRRVWRIGRRVGGFLIALLVVAGARRAEAATFLVTSAADTTDGVCSPAPDGCTLREAIEAVVATPGRDTIRFDPEVFPRAQALKPIVVASPLPVIADPAGTVVDGAGTSVFVTAGNNGVPSGLVFASAPGVPLAKVTVANLIVASFTVIGVHVCGGEVPTCGEDVSGTVVERVITNATADGVRVEGRNITKTRIVDSIGLHLGGPGIRLFAKAGLVGWRVQGCTFRDCDGDGIHASAGGDNVGGAILDTSVFDSGLGITVRAKGRVAKARVASTTTVLNRGPGVFVSGGAGTTGVSIDDYAATANTAGIVVASATAHDGPKLTNVVADGSFSDGVLIEGKSTGAKINGLVALANGTAGVSLADNALGASVSGVVAAANATDGIAIRGSASKIQKIRSDGNGGSGILLTPLQNGLTGTSSGNTVQKSMTGANDGHGIFVGTGVTDSRVQKSVALGNGDNDFRDGNPDCDANVWSGNVFGTSTDSCIQ